jgi:two-component system OmpR family response regulator
MVDGAGPRVLVVEDDAAIRELIDTRLTLAGYRVGCASNGLRALELLALRPKAVVLDVNMPGLDGFGVLEWMQPRGLTETCPVIMLTARSDGDDVRRCLSLGAKDYLCKPFADATLIARVARLLRPRRTPARAATYL